MNTVKIEDCHRCNFRRKGRCCARSRIGFKLKGLGVRWSRNGQLAGLSMGWRDRRCPLPFMAVAASDKPS